MAQFLEGLQHTLEEYQHMAWQEHQQKYYNKT
jgi:hypothetical protein